MILALTLERFAFAPTVVVLGQQEQRNLPRKQSINTKNKCFDFCYSLNITENFRFSYNLLEHPTFILLNFNMDNI